MNLNATVVVDLDGPTSGDAANARRAGQRGRRRARATSPSYAAIA
jgi:hypothetical protein